jgi:DNA-binding PadR family transcriptional regulator
MSTKHTILALLAVEPMTGYELAQNMKISVDRLWAATHSQIYPLLRKLEDEGLVCGASATRGQVMQRIVYSLTPAGHEEFARWLRQPVQYLPFRDPFKLWASYLDECPPEVAFRTIDTHIRLHQQLAANLERLADDIAAGRHPLIRVRARHLSPPEVDRIRRTRSLVYYELAAQARFEVESAKRIRRYAQELFPEHAAPAPASEREDTG